MHPREEMLMLAKTAAYYAVVFVLAAAVFWLIRH